ncbi:hypothetical protein KO493_00495 [Tamlana agarivorans]|uniref:Uncharacterized protein n=1 Tax=Pseudotamlana agarivorans TaxID=481183 RepID=A0ACC5U4F3_9FLAO|nr:hypothetical protein [Tamlana agarivorans]MBU2949177.1 hypothetical protein [Tamlana agarivorans]
MRNLCKKLKIIGFVLFILFTIVINAQGKYSNWPKEIKSGDYIVKLYNPENESYLDNKLISNFAFSVKKGKEEPVFGMLWATSLLDVDRATRMVSIASLKIDEVKLPVEISQSDKKAFETLINNEIPKWNIEFSLDELLEELDEVSVNNAELKNEAPSIIFSNEPAVLILIDGEPKLKAAVSGYEIVENSDTFIIKESKTNTFYLKGGKFWYSSKQAMGPWDTAEKVPSEIKKIAKKAELNEDDSSDTYTGKAPKIIVANPPSELIVFEGEPKFTPLQKTNLLFVENTGSDIFMNITDQNYFILLSGRWFTTKDLKGNWSYLSSEKLPADFKKIQSDSKKGEVLSSVAGTKEAKNALYDAQIPQTAAVQRDTKASKVTYNGSPEFKNIENLKLQYAVNTESDVFKDRSTYYLCDNAVWFKSSSPNGPWQVADERPSEVEKIPAENPKFNTKYVYIYETSPTVVYVGYTPGYYGSYAYGPTVVYGTGFYYNPWYRGYYYPRHYTYGFSIRYNPWNGWSFGFGFGSPYGWYGHSYWGYHRHHWGPPYYRPPYHRPPHQRPPNHGGNRPSRPKPTHPIYKDRDGIKDYTRPVQRPDTRPSTRPGTQPSTRPSTRPSTQPSTRPSTRPSTQPSTRPNTRPSNTPNTRPSTRPTPSYRPTPRPATRPTARPSTPSRSRPAPSPRRRN